jgi:hypothetical protein
VSTRPEPALTHWWASPIQIAIREMESELRTLRAERDDYRQRWLHQVDINDRLRATLAGDAAWEAMGRE